MNNFLNNGYVILRNAINKKLVKDIQNTVFESLNLKKNKNYNSFLNAAIKTKKNNFDFTLPFHKKFIDLEIYSKICKQKKIISFLKDNLGSDLCHHDDPSITLNTSNKNSFKQNYHFKNWHQELWSGASISTIALWSPIFHLNSQMGQIEFIKGSHLWGHVPHKNREVEQLPKKFEVFKTNLNYGDVVLFHALTMHRTSKLISKKISAKLSIVSHVKNFKINDYAFNRNKNWRIFYTSDLTKVEKKLGNHYLSPYRTKKLD